MRLCEIIERLNDYPITYMEQKNPNIEITGIRMITKSQTVFLPNILYFGETTALPRKSQKGYCVNFLCYGSISARPDLYGGGGNMNLLLIASEEDASQIYNKIQDIFLESEQVVAGMRAFLDALFADTGLQGICDVAYGILGNPLFIVDNSYKYLAFSFGNRGRQQADGKGDIHGADRRGGHPADTKDAAR